MQTIRVPLPEHPDHPGVEQWAELRDVSTLRAGDRKAVNKTLRWKIDENGRIESTFSPGDMDDLTNAVLARVIVNWSYALPLPQADPASLDELPLDAWEALEEATKPHRQALDFSRRRDPAETKGSTGSSG